MQLVYIIYPFSDEDIVNNDNIQNEFDQHENLASEDKVKVDY